MIFIDELPERFSGEEERWSKLYLYKPEMGQYDVVALDDGREYVDSYSSSVIEYSRTTIWYECKRISQGRLYVVMKYYNKNDDYVSKCDELNTWYQALCRWIRKNVPKHEYENPLTLEYVNRMGFEYGVAPGYKCKEHISDSLLRLVQEEGYHTN